MTDWLDRAIKVAVVILLIALIGFTGWVVYNTLERYYQCADQLYNKNITFETASVVAHNSSLTEAYSKCREKCSMIYGHECKWFFLERSHEGLSYTTKLSECTDHECLCEC